MKKKFLKNLCIIICTLFFVGCAHLRVEEDPLHVYPAIDFQFDESRCEYANVERGIDGDTFLLESGHRVRMIGVDTPETVDKRKDVQFYGFEASKKLKNLLNGKEVCLLKDFINTDDEDIYNRLLRYVWLNEEFINAKLIEEGYAFAYVNYPFQYVDEFSQLEVYARHKSLGLWNGLARHKFIIDQEIKENKPLLCGTQGVICPENAKNFVGQNVVVRLKIAQVYDSGETIYINSLKNHEDPHNVSVKIEKEFRENFSEILSQNMQNTIIEISGVVNENQGRIVIDLQSTSQLYFDA